MKCDAVIRLPRSSDYFFEKHRYRAMQSWLEEREVEFFAMKTMDGGEVPHTLVMDSVSAVAFRLQFGI